MPGPLCEGVVPQGPSVEDPGGMPGPLHERGLLRSPKGLFMPVPGVRGILLLWACVAPTGIPCAWHRARSSASARDRAMALAISSSSDFFLACSSCSAESCSSGAAVVVGGRSVPAGGAAGWRHAAPTAGIKVSTAVVHPGWSAPPGAEASPVVLPRGVAGWRHAGVKFPAAVPLGVAPVPGWPALAPAPAGALASVPKGMTAVPCSPRCVWGLSACVACNTATPSPPGAATAAAGMACNAATPSATEPSGAAKAAAGAPGAAPPGTAPHGSKWSVASESPCLCRTSSGSTVGGVLGTRGRGVNAAAAASRSSSATISVGAAGDNRLLSSHFWAVCTHGVPTGVHAAGPGAAGGALESAGAAGCGAEAVCSMPAGVWGAEPGIAGCGQKSAWVNGRGAEAIRSIFLPLPSGWLDRSHSGMPNFFLLQDLSLSTTGACAYNGVAAAPVGGGAGACTGVAAAPGGGACSPAGPGVPGTASDARSGVDGGACTARGPSAASHCTGLRGAADGSGARAPAEVRGSGPPPSHCVGVVRDIASGVCGTATAAAAGPPAGALSAACLSVRAGDAWGPPAEPAPAACGASCSGWAGAASSAEPRGGTATAAASPPGVGPAGKSSSTVSWFRTACREAVCLAFPAAAVCLAFPWAAFFALADFPFASDGLPCLRGG